MPLPKFSQFLFFLIIMMVLEAIIYWSMVKDISIATLNRSSAGSFPSSLFCCIWPPLYRSIDENFTHS